MTIQIGMGLSTKRDSLVATQEAVRQAKLNFQSQKISLAVVFSSLDFAHIGVFRAINNLLGPVPLIGCSSLAIISQQGIFKHGIVIMLLGLPEAIYFNTACVKEISAKPIAEAGREFADKLLYGFKGIRRDVGMMFSDGLMADGSSFINGLQEKLGMSFPLAGASASDNLAFKRTYLYFNEEVLNDAACGVLWGGKLNFGFGIRHGWKPLGKPHQVTSSSGNIVYEIDNAPAVDIYEEYLAYDLAKLKRELKYVSVFYPIGVYLEGEDEYLLRNILLAQDDGALIFQGNVPQDSRIRLMIGTKESCLAATAQALNEAKAALLGRQPACVFIFDSVSRYILLGRQAQRELEIIKENLGKDTPIIGLYTYGEQAPLKALNYQGRTYFHNQTITIFGIEG